MNEILMTMIVDASNDEVIERPMTPDEITEYKAIQSEVEARQAEAEAKATARESALAKLAKLGLTADEVAAL
jgi:hypothetical protein